LLVKNDEEEGVVMREKSTQLVLGATMPTDTQALTQGTTPPAIQEWEHDMTQTFPSMTSRSVQAMADEVWAWCEKARAFGRTVTVKIKHADFPTGHAHPNPACDRHV
jgi:hypothetical protein